MRRAIVSEWWSSRSPRSSTFPGAHSTAQNLRSASTKSCCSVVSPVATRPLRLALELRERPAPLLERDVRRRDAVADVERGADVARRPLGERLGEALLARRARRVAPARLARA